MTNLLTVALVLEGLGFLYQKVIKAHPMSCTCKTCVAIEISIPITLSITLASNQKHYS